MRTSGARYGATPGPGEYENFRIALSALGGGEHRYRAQVVESPAGEGSHDFTLDLDDAALSRLTASFDAARQRSDRNLLPDDDEGGGAVGETPQEVVHQLGRDLYDKLFAGEVGTLWEASRYDNDRSKRSLRILLQMRLDGPGTARLHALPWECLHPGKHQLPLLQTPRVSLVRYLSQGRLPPEIPQPDRLKILAVSADISGPELDALDLDGELNVLKRELDDRSVPVDLVMRRNVPVEALDDLLAKYRPHVFHFLGHGDFTDSEQGILYLRDGDGERRLDAAALARCLEPCDELRLVFLNACVTARASHRAPFAGVAPALVRKVEVPAVLAMQRPISDAGAARFAAEVYRHLGRGSSLDHAVGRGRTRLAESTEWTTPVLFSRLKTGRLFAPAEAVAPGREQASRRPAWAGWAAALVLLLTLGTAGVLWGPLQGEHDPTKLPPVLTDQRDPASPGTSQGTKPPTDGTESQEEPFEPPTSEPDRSPSEPPTVYDLADGDRVYLPEIDSFVSATWHEDFVYPTLNLDSSDFPRAVERPRRVEFPLADGSTVSLWVIDIDGEARTLTLRIPEPTGGESAG